MNKILQFACICLVFCSLMPVSYGQQVPDADELFLVARDAAFNEQWEESRRLSREVLRHYPDYHDATLLIGRTYAWEMKHDSARMTVRPLLEAKHDNYDVLNLLADVEIWDQQYDDALEIINRALLYYPWDEDLLFKRANALYLNKDYVNAIIAVETLLNINPNHAEGRELQTNIQYPQVAEIYNKAEAETRAGNWAEARKYSRQVLALEPDHFPASLLLAQNFAFESKFDSARIVTTELYREHPDDYQLLDLMIDIEIWNRKYKAALTQADRALAAHPDDDNFLYKKALIQYLQKDYDDALATLDHLLSDEVNPTHADGIALRNLILQNHRYRDYLLHEHYFEYAKNRDDFGFYTRKWITSTGLAKWTKYGTYIGKLNIGHDWGMNHENLVGAVGQLPAYQLELEAYQTLWPTATLWLNYAARLDTGGFFPKHRGGAELFQRLPENLEASLGFRFMHWNETTWIWTGSISWVPNLNYFSWRFFLTGEKLRMTNVFTYRRYFSQRPEYFYVLAGYGSYSDEFFHLADNLGMTWLWQAGVHKFLSQRWLVLAAVGAHHDSGYQDRWMAQAGVRYYFNMFR